MSEQPSDRLGEVRSEIDSIDSQIAGLLGKRLDLVCEIAELKKLMGKPIIDASREQAVLENIRKKIGDPGYEEAIVPVFEHIIRNSREFQQKKLESGFNRAHKYCLIGEKLSHSLSPQIHECLFRKLGISGTYGLVEVSKDNLPGITERLKGEGYAGFNVTIPYKKDIMQFLDFISPEAIRVGSVNTVSLRGRSSGYNTDYLGFGFSLDQNGFDPKGKRCAVLGSGGSALAVVSYLEDRQAADIVIVSRDPDAALFKFPGLASRELCSFGAEGYDIVINTTPVGMYPNISSSPLSREQLAGAGYVMDLIFNPSETLLLQYADSLGIRLSNGLLMLVAQAVSAEEIWLGGKIDSNLINDIYEEVRNAL